MECWHRRAHLFPAIGRLRSQRRHLWGVPRHRRFVALPG